jgi:hypothetical protein
MQTPALQGIVRRRILVNFRVDPEVIRQPPAALPPKAGSWLGHRRNLLDSARTASAQRPSGYFGDVQRERSTPDRSDLDGRVG